MKIIDNYNDLKIGPLQQTRLYMQGRPLVRLWRQQRNNIIYQRPAWVDLIDQELTQDYLALDCAGWYFASSQRQCQCIELWPGSIKFWPNTVFEYDYLTWVPTYIHPTIVLAYYSEYFKYSEFDDMITFFNLWMNKHKKLIVGLDPTKIKFNYLKYDFLTLLLNQLELTVNLRVLSKSPFDLLFVMEKT
jgi:hypothetical protein